ncbi:hypothetical protein FQN57_000446 [Myotisia sp. PD_48]|nr:hypothetical protein FQN57_000446 [Myotisia sp. PD_48]
MASSEIWVTLLTATDPLSMRAMPSMLQSTIELLESELARARAALQEIQSQPELSCSVLKEDMTAEAMAAYKSHLLERVAATSNINLPMISMSQQHQHHQHHHHQQEGARSFRHPRRTALIDILSNSLVLDNLAPYVPVSSLLALAATSRKMRSLIMDTPYVFRYLDLTRCSGARVPWMRPVDRGEGSWRDGGVDESLTEDEFYSGPLRGILANLERKSILQDVRTLVLDGLSVTAEFIADILLSDRFNVSILSIRDCFTLNEKKLMQTIRYAVRPSRAKGMPRIKAIYCFTPRNPLGATSDSTSSTTTASNSSNSSPSLAGQRQDLGSTPSLGRPDSASTHTNYSDIPGHDWYTAPGKIFRNPIETGWAETIQLARGIISFDAALCRSPRHNPGSGENRNSSPSPPFLPPAIATVSLGSQGCERCHSSPEGPLVWNRSSEDHFPLLAPPPLHSYRTTDAKNPATRPGEEPVLIVQCEECLRGRWCHRCNRWWCIACLPDPNKPGSRPTLPIEIASSIPLSAEGEEGSAGLEMKTAGNADLPALAV